MAEQVREGVKVFGLPMHSNYYAKSTCSFDMLHVGKTELAA
jgi:hypothetical protein